MLYSFLGEVYYEAFVCVIPNKLGEIRTYSKVCPHILLLLQVNGLQLVIYPKKKKKSELQLVIIYNST